MSQLTSEQQKRLDEIKAHVADLKNQPKEVEVTKDEPMTKEEAITGPVSTGTVTPSDADAIQQRMGEIEKEYSGLAGSIPLNHEYWVLKNQLQALRNK